MTSWITLITWVAVTSSAYVAGSCNRDAAFLSPLIANGRIKKARCMSRVTYDFVKGRRGTSVKSYAGYITVNTTYDSNLFFWFFPAQNNATTAPVVLWLNGGPGVSSVVGAMVENGPLKITQKGLRLALEALNNEPLYFMVTVVRSKVSWTESFNMLYIDNPVGTGYSFTKNDAGMADTVADLVPQLYSFLLQFYKMFPEHLANELYIGGQSYAGKYIPSLGQYIHDQNHVSPAPNLILPMKGVYLGAGFCDPQTMLPEFAETLYYTGLISDYTRRTFRAEQMGLINESLSTGVFDALKDGDKLSHGAQNVSEDGDINNMLGGEHSPSKLNLKLADFMSSLKTREALHVGLANGKENVTSDDDPSVWYRIMPLSMFINTNKENAVLMDNYKVLHYSGNLDLVVSVAMTEAFLKKVQWTGADQYRDSIRYPWFQDGSLRGWVTQIGNFTRVVVKNAGHYAPYDQPEAAFLMMKNFIFDEPFPDMGLVFEGQD